MHFPHADAVDVILILGLVLRRSGISNDNNGDSSNGCCRRQRLCGNGIGRSGRASGSSDATPRGQPSPRRRSFFGGDAACLPELPEIVAFGSGAALVRSTKSVPLTRLRLRTERVSEAKARAAAPDVR